MNKNEFEDWMNNHDQLYHDSGTPIWRRSLSAWGKLTKYQTYTPNRSYNSNLGPYEDTNLMLSIEDWYRQRYPPASASIEDWGSRLVLIRGVVFELKIPFIFNAKIPLDPFTHCSNLSRELQNSLTETESHNTTNRFNLNYREASAIQRTLTRLIWHGPKRAQELFEAGWTDLRAIPGVYRPRDHTALLYLAHQAIEKGLKSRIVYNEPNFSDEQLRRKFGHNLHKLSTACTVIDNDLESIQQVYKLYDYGQEVRYSRPNKSLEETIMLVDYAYNIMAAVAVSIRKVGPE